MAYNTREAEPYFGILGWVLIISHLGFYFFHLIVATPGGYENITLRIIASACGAFLVLYKYIPKFITNNFTFVFYPLLCFNFPFFFTFMLLNNQDYGSWQVGGLVGLILLSFFVDYLSFIILAGIGIGLAFLTVSIFGHFGPNVNLIGIFGSYSPPIIYFLIFSKKRKELQDAKNNYLLHIKELNDSLEIKVKNRTAELEKALESKTDFLNSMSHEIRTPIHGFTNISEGLVEYWENFDENKKYKCAQEVARNAEKLEKLLNTLLDMSKFNAHKMSLSLKQSDLRQLVQDVIDECKGLYLSKKHIEINFLSNHKILALMDKERIEQVLRNLFFNAIKFSFDNSIIIASLKQIKNSDGSGSINFTITDSGVGIPEEELESIFDPFTQSSRTKTVAGGTGLGLSICRQIIEAHQGKIWATNNLENGSSFHFSIPITQSANGITPDKF